MMRGSASNTRPLVWVYDVGVPAPGNPAGTGVRVLEYRGCQAREERIGRAVKRLIDAQSFTNDQVIERPVHGTETPWHLDVGQNA